MRSRRDERGVSAIIFALMLTALLTMSAFAVDLGSAFTERRHDQNTADAAVMSAVVKAVIGGGVINDVVAEVKTKVNTTLDREVTDAEWTNCEDSEPLYYTTVDLQTGNPTINPVTECISFSQDFSRVRVKLPQQDVLMVFAPALGLPSLQTTAAAEAEVVNGAGTGAPPFVALSTATQGDFVCLRTSQQGNPKDTDPMLDGRGPGVGPAAGTRGDACRNGGLDTSPENYGTLSPFAYTRGCTRQNIDITQGVSVGIDHIMGYFPNGFTGTLGAASPGDRIDGGGSPGCTVAFPNTFRIDTGFNAQMLRCALIGGGGPCNTIGSPRFQQGDYLQSTYKYAGRDIDNSAPWDFLRDARDLYNLGAPEYCVWVATFRPEDGTFDPGEIGGGADIDEVGWGDYVDPVTGLTSPITTSNMKDSDWDDYDRFDALTQCLEDWDSTTDPELFTLDIGTTPRFAFIPQVAEADLDHATYVHIEAFLPTFMYRMYQEAGNHAHACDPLDTRTDVNYYVHSAGGNYTCADPGGKIHRLSSIIFACGMVPNALCDKATGQPADAGQDIYEFRLAK